MRFIVLFIFTLWLITLTSCNKGLNHPRTLWMYSPPNLTQISKDLFIDRTVLTNSNYREYLHFLRTRYDDFSLYKKALPDTMIWLSLDSCFHYLKNMYFRDPKYHDYPAFGISHEQALHYTQWRTNRVMEIVLYKEGYLKNDLGKDRNHENFTVEKYFKNEYNTSRHKNVKYYLHFEIPQDEDIKTIAHSKKIKIQNNVYSNSTHYNDSIYSVDSFFLNLDMQKNVYYNYSPFLKEWNKNGQILNTDILHTFTPLSIEANAKNVFSKFMSFRNVCFVRWVE